MEKKDKVCLTTYIYGVKYQAYIPFLIYSCHKSYPEYDIRLYLYDKLDENIKKQIDTINAQNVTIKEQHFANCPKMNALKAKSLRWVLWDEEFMNYDYLYVVDIDMLYIKEPTPLHKQHVAHMQTTGLPYDNLVREYIRKPFNFNAIAFRLKYAGIQSILPFLFGTRKEHKLTGLHFIMLKPYYKLLDAEKREKYTRLIYNNKFLKKVMFANNEVFLYNMLKENDMHPELLATQTDSSVMLDFNNFHRLEFRPHHGIHMGLFRNEIPLKARTDKTLNSDVYRYYIDRFKQEYLHDSQFICLLRQSGNDIKKQFDNLFKYYDI